MTYTQLSLTSIALAVLADRYVLRTHLVRRRSFWVSYAIILFFQLVSNGVLTGFGIVRYSGDAILGETSPEVGSPPFIGQGRLAFAPLEDLGFGFSLVLLTLALWVTWGRRGIQREPQAGPARRVVARLFR